MDIELAAIFAFFLYRQEQSDGGRGVWRAWLDRYVQILGQKETAGTGRIFSSLLAGKPGHGALAGATDSLAAEFRALLSQLGVDWGAHEIGDPLLAQFVAARNVFLCRWERISGDSKLKVALAKQEQTIAALRQGFEQQERNIEQLHTKIQPLQDLLVEKDRDSQIQADEIHRLHDVVVEKDRASQRQADEIHRLYDVLVEKDQVSQVQADEFDRLHGIVEEQAKEIQRLTVSEGNLNDALIAKGETHAVKQQLA